MSLQCARDGVAVRTGRNRMCEKNLDEGVTALLFLDVYGDVPLVSYTLKGAKMIKQTTALTLLTALVAGCAQSAPPPQTAAATIDVAPGFGAAEGRTFYIFRAGYKCGGPMASSPQVASWVDKVEVRDGRLVRWGSRCGGEGLPVPEAERTTARLNRDATTLTIGGKTYRQSTDPEKEAEGRP